MNYCVPDFGIEEEDSLASAFGFINPKILRDSVDDDIPEILWQKGPVVRRFLPPDRSGEPPERGRRGSIAKAETAGGELFMGEDEMASWLHNSPENGGNAGEDSPAVVDRSLVVLRPPPPGATPSRYVASRESTVVGSNVTVHAVPAAALESSASMAAERSNSPLTCEKVPVSSSMATTHGDSRKRKARESDDSDAEVADYDSDDKKKDHRRPARRSRAAEVHNLSERRRRDRINEKMKALQQLIPRCNKSDKASMLDDAVEYIKTLQLQVQMMSMGYPMTPMMYAGLPQYAPPTGTPMGMGIDTSSGCMTHPMLPFSPVMQSPPVSGASTGHLGARMPMPAFAFHPAAMAAGGQLREQTTSQPDPQSNFMCLQAPNRVQMPNLPYPCHQYYGFQHMQFPSQGQNVTETGTSNASSTQEKSDSKLG